LPGFSFGLNVNVSPTQQLSDALMFGFTQPMLRRHSRYR
jgi:hypothetical protein